MQFKKFIKIEILEHQNKLTLQIIFPLAKDSDAVRSDG